MQNLANRAKVLGFGIDIVDKSQALAITEDFIEKKTGAHVVTINPEIILEAQHNEELASILNKANLVFADGVGVVLALKSKNIITRQIPGIEYSESLIELSAKKGYTIGFLGASNETVNLAADKMRAKYPEAKIVYIQDGFFKQDDEPQIVEKLKEINPDILFVALGAPKQEIFISKNRETLSSTVMVGVGGSFDVWSEKIQRAPVFFRKFGLEWLYRLLSQPSRFNRMFPTLPLFLLKAVLDNKNTGR